MVTIPRTPGAASRRQKAVPVVAGEQACVPALPWPAALTESAVIVPVPEAEAVAGVHRDRLDKAAALGVPAHVTVLYPFVPPVAARTGVIAALAEAVSSVSAFACEFPVTGWFGEDVLWLGPRPDGPFRALIHAVMAAFPGCLPYRGVHSEVIPHLTIGDKPPGGASALRAAETAVAASLPIQAWIKHAWLMAGNEHPGSWRTITTLPLRHE